MKFLFILILINYFTKASDVLQRENELLDLNFKQRGPDFYFRYRKPQFMTPYVEPEKEEDEFSHCHLIYNIGLRPECAEYHKRIRECAKKEHFGEELDPECIALLEKLTGVPSEFNFLTLPTYMPGYGVLKSEYQEQQFLANYRILSPFGIVPQFIADSLNALLDLTISVFGDYESMKKNYHRAHIVQECVRDSISGNKRRITEERGSPFIDFLKDRQEDEKEVRNTPSDRNQTAEENTTPENEQVTPVDTLVHKDRGDAPFNSDRRSNSLINDRQGHVTVSVNVNTGGQGDATVNVKVNAYRQGDPTVNADRKSAVAVNPDTQFDTEKISGPITSDSLNDLDNNKDAGSCFTQESRQASDSTEKQIKDQSNSSTQCSPAIMKCLQIHFPVSNENNQGPPVGNDSPGNAGQNAKRAEDSSVDVSSKYETPVKIDSEMDKPPVTTRIHGEKPVNSRIGSSLSPAADAEKRNMVNSKDHPTVTPDLPVNQFEEEEDSQFVPPNHILVAGAVLITVSTITFLAYYTLVYILFSVPRVMESIAESIAQNYSRSERSFVSNFISRIKRMFRREQSAVQQPTARQQEPDNNFQGYAMALDDALPRSVWEPAWVQLLTNQSQGYPTLQLNSEDAELILRAIANGEIRLVINDNLLIRLNMAYLLNFHNMSHVRMITDTENGFEMPYEEESVTAISAISLADFTQNCNVKPNGIDYEERALLDNLCCMTEKDIISGTDKWYIDNTLRDNIVMVVINTITHSMEKLADERKRDLRVSSSSCQQKTLKVDGVHSNETTRKKSDISDLNISISKQTKKSLLGLTDTLSADDLEAPTTSKLSGRRTKSGLSKPKVELGTSIENDLGGYIENMIHRSELQIAGTSDARRKSTIIDSKNEGTDIDRLFAHASDRRKSTTAVLKETVEKEVQPFIENILPKGSTSSSAKNAEFKEKENAKTTDEGVAIHLHKTNIMLMVEAAIKKTMGKHIDESVRQFLEDVTDDSVSEMQDQPQKPKALKRDIEIDIENDIVSLIEYVVINPKHVTTGNLEAKTERDTLKETLERDVVAFIESSVEKKNKPETKSRRNSILKTPLGHSLFGLIQSVQSTRGRKMGKEKAASDGTNKPQEPSSSKSKRVMIEESIENSIIKLIENVIARSEGNKNVTSESNKSSIASASSQKVSIGDDIMALIDDIIETRYGTKGKDKRGTVSGNTSRSGVLKSTVPSDIANLIETIIDEATEPSKTGSQQMVKQQPSDRKAGKITNFEETAVGSKKERTTGKSTGKDVTKSRYDENKSIKPTGKDVIKTKANNNRFPFSLGPSGKGKPTGKGVTKTTNENYEKASVAVTGESTSTGRKPTGKDVNKTKASENRFSFPLGPSVKENKQPGVGNKNQKIKIDQKQKNRQKRRDKTKRNKRGVKSNKATAKNGKKGLKNLRQRNPITQKGEKAKRKGKMEEYEETSSEEDDEDETDSDESDVTSVEDLLEGDFTNSDTEAYGMAAKRSKNKAKENTSAGIQKKKESGKSRQKDATKSRETDKSAKTPKAGTRGKQPRIGQKSQKKNKYAKGKWKKDISGTPYLDEFVFAKEKKEKQAKLKGRKRKSKKVAEDIWLDVEGSDDDGETSASYENEIMIYETDTENIMKIVTHTKPKIKEYISSEKVAAANKEIASRKSKVKDLKKTRERQEASTSGARKSNKQQKVERKTNLEEKSKMGKKGGKAKKELAKKAKKGVRNLKGGVAKLKQTRSKPKVVIEEITDDDGSEVSDVSSEDELEDEDEIPERKYKQTVKRAKSKTKEKVKSDKTSGEISKGRSSRKLKGTDVAKTKESVKEKASKSDKEMDKKDKKGVSNLKEINATKRKDEMKRKENVSSEEESENEEITERKKASKSMTGIGKKDRKGVRNLKESDSPKRKEKKAKRKDTKSKENVSSEEEIVSSEEESETEDKITERKKAFKSNKEIDKTDKKGVRNLRESDEAKRKEKKAKRKDKMREDKKDIGSEEDIVRSVNSEEESQNEDKVTGREKASELNEEIGKNDKKGVRNLIESGETKMKEKTVKQKDKRRSKKDDSLEEEIVSSEEESENEEEITESDTQERAKWKAKEKVKYEKILKESQSGTSTGKESTKTKEKAKSKSKERTTSKQIEEGIAREQAEQTPSPTSKERSGKQGDKDVAKTKEKAKSEKTSVSKERPTTSKPKEKGIVQEESASIELTMKKKVPKSNKEKNVKLEDNITEGESSADNSDGSDEEFLTVGKIQKRSDIKTKERARGKPTRKDGAKAREKAKTEKCSDKVTQKNKETKCKCPCSDIESTVSISSDSEQLDNETDREEDNQMLKRRKSKQKDGKKRKAEGKSIEEESESEIIDKTDSETDNQLVKSRKSKEKDGMKREEKVKSESHSFENQEASTSKKSYSKKGDRRHQSKTRKASSEEESDNEIINYIIDGYNQMVKSRKSKEKDGMEREENGKSESHSIENQEARTSKKSYSKKRDRRQKSRKRNTSSEEESDSEADIKANQMLKSRKIEVRDGKKRQEKGKFEENYFGDQEASTSAKSYTRKDDRENKSKKRKTSSASFRSAEETSSEENSEDGIAHGSADSKGALVPLKLGDFRMDSSDQLPLIYSTEETESDEDVEYDYEKEVRSEGGIMHRNKAHVVSSRKIASASKGIITRPDMADVSERGFVRSAKDIAEKTSAETSSFGESKGKRYASNEIIGKTSKTEEKLKRDMYMHVENSLEEIIPSIDKVVSLAGEIVKNREQEITGRSDDYIEPTRERSLRSHENAAITNEIESTRLVEELAKPEMFLHTENSLKEIMYTFNKVTSLAAELVKKRDQGIAQPHPRDRHFITSKESESDVGNERATSTLKETQIVRPKEYKKENHISKSVQTFEEREIATKTVDSVGKVCSTSGQSFDEERREIATPVNHSLSEIELAESAIHALLLVESLHRLNSLSDFFLHRTDRPTPWTIHPDHYFPQHLHDESYRLFAAEHLSQAEIQMRYAHTQSHQAFPFGLFQTLQAPQTRSAVEVTDFIGDLLDDGNIADVCNPSRSTQHESRIRSRDFVIQMENDKERLSLKESSKLLVKAIGDVCRSVRRYAPPVPTTSDVGHVWTSFRRDFRRRDSDYRRRDSEIDDMEAQTNQQTYRLGQKQSV